MSALLYRGPVLCPDAAVASACPPGQTFPGRDVCVVPCIPVGACLGDNACAPGYASKAPLFRCGYCAPGFYRSNDACILCPDSPAGLVIGFVLIAIAGAAAAYYADKKKINVAFVAIGVDYAQVRHRTQACLVAAAYCSAHACCQVLAIFSNSKVQWPPALLRLFTIMSAFNLNIDIVA